jgi:hypothetical protein
MRFRLITLTALFFSSQFSLVLASYSCAGPVSSEEPQQAPQKKEESKGAQEEREKKILVLLNDLVTNSTSITVAENRTQSLIRASEMLWTRDEKLARALIGKVRNEILALNAQLAQGKNRTSGSRSDLSKIREDLRSAMMKTLCSKDGNLALDFLRATYAPIVDAPIMGREKKNPDYDKKAEEGVWASQIAAHDPQLAFQLAEELITVLNSSYIVSIWRNLRRKDPQLGAKLLTVFVAKYKSSDLSGSNEELDPGGVPLTVLPILRHSINDSSGSSGDSVTQEREAYRELLDWIADSGLKITPDNMGASDLKPMPQSRNRAQMMKNLLDYQGKQLKSLKDRILVGYLKFLMPEIEKQFPSRAAALRAKITELEKASEEPIDVYYWARDFKRVEMEGKSATELLDMASLETSPRMKNDIYAEAVRVADTRTRKKILEEHPHIMPGRAPGPAFIKDYGRGWDEVKSEDVENLLSQSYINTPGKVVALAHIAAEAFTNRKDEKTARELLDRAQGIIEDEKIREKKTPPPLKGKLSVRTVKERYLVERIAIAGAYRNFDPNRSFEILESVMDSLAPNRLVESPLSMHEYSGILHALASELAQLARNDFDRAAGLLKKWRSNEIRVMMTANFLFCMLDAEYKLQDDGLGVDFLGLRLPFQYYHPSRRTR